MSEDIKKYYPLGSKTLFMMIFKKSMILLLLLPPLVAGIYFLPNVPGDYYGMLVSVMYAYSGILLFIFVLIFFVSWLEYIRYSIVIDERSLKIQRGFFSVEEFGIPHRRIKEIKVRRDIVDQIFGVSNLIIILLDSETPKAEAEDTILLPSLEKEIAKDIQDNILRRAQVEQVHVSDIRSSM